MVTFEIATAVLDSNALSIPVWRELCINEIKQQCNVLFLIFPYLNVALLRAVLRKRLDLHLERRIASYLTVSYRYDIVRSSLHAYLTYI